MPEAFHHIVPRTDTATTIRLLRESDLERFHAYRSDEELAKYQGWRAMSVGDARSFLLEMGAVRSLVPGEWIQLGIADPQSDALIGDIGLFLDAGQQWAELGFTLSRGAQGRGHATRAARAAVDLALTTTPAEEVRGITDARNAASIRVLERAGFRFSARQETVFKGEFCTELVYVHARA